MVNSPTTYPVETVARLLDLSPRRVQQLVGEGVIPKAERGRYELVPAVQGYIRYLKAKAINSDAVGDDGTDKRRLLKARADIAEMEAERLAGDLVEVAQVTKTWANLMSFVRQKMLGLPPDVAELAAMDGTIDGCHEIYDTHVIRILAELAALSTDGLSETADLPENRLESPGAAAEADDQRMGGSLSEAE